MADVSAGSREALARDAALLTRTVREAGALAHSMFRTELKKWTKGASSPVSEADIAVNDLLEDRLRSATPDYGWLSEESVDDEARLGKPLVWIVDPIDGTRAYLAGREDWCVSVALVQAPRRCLRRYLRLPPRSFSLRCAEPVQPATTRRCTRHRARSWIFRESPAQNR